jgi:transposase
MRCIIPISPVPNRPACRATSRANSPIGVGRATHSDPSSTQSSLSCVSAARGAGALWAVCRATSPVTPASTHDKVGAWRLLAGLAPLVPRLAKIRADGAYTSRELACWHKDDGGRDSEIVGRDPGAQGFALQTRRWVVEPGALWGGFAWLVRNRRLRIDDERRVRASETLAAVAFTRLQLRRLTGQAQPQPIRHILATSDGGPIRYVPSIAHAVHRSVSPVIGGHAPPA